MQILDIGLGLIFIYLLISIVCTSANELISGLFKWRAENLKKGIENLLKNKGKDNLEKDFYGHPLIKSLYKGDRKPSYIPPLAFSRALIDLIATVDDPNSGEMKYIRDKICLLPKGSDLRNNLLIFLEEAAENIEQFRKNVEMWFNDAMTRVSGWYKRKTQAMILIIALIVTVAANIDTIVIAKSLSNDAALRQALVAQAQEYLREKTPIQQEATTGKNPEEKESPKKIQAADGAANKKDAAGAPHEQIETTVEKIQQLGIPLGWNTAPAGIAWINKIIGLLITALAASLGTPFWFDILKKVTNIRSSGASTEEPSEGRKN